MQYLTTSLNMQNLFCSISSQSQISTITINNISPIIALISEVDTEEIRFNATAQKRIADTKRLAEKQLSEF
ncbi:1521_t:CDS:1, partial [Ambispora leptoticha]